ncbi:MAG: coxL [Dehalococcoidia bacterium]|nr:coxL [Dehalococcoidia bacterium]
MTTLSVIGKSIPRVDAPEKVTGIARYCLDMKLPGMLYARVLRSPYPHARIVRIDTSRAEKMSGVKAVVTGKDAPEERVGQIKDRYIIAKDVVRFMGEPVAAVAAETPEVAEAAIALIRVDYQELPAVFDPEEAMKHNPPVVIHPDLFGYDLAPVTNPAYYFDHERPNVYIWRKIRHGDVERGFKEADLIMENRFTAARMSHSVLEPHNVLVRPESNGGLTVWANSTRIHFSKIDLCHLFHLTPSKVRVISPHIGGSFGSRNHLEPVMGQATLLALKARRPVRLSFTLQEDFLEGTSREPIIIYIKDGVKKDGTLVARKVTLILNCGAYCGNMTAATKNCVFPVTSLYRVPNCHIDAYGVATNEATPVSFTGFGNAQIAFALEQQMDMMADRLGLDPLEIRRRNILREGDEDACGQTVHSTGAKECLEKAAQWIELDKEPPLERGPWRRGKGVGMGCKHTLTGDTSVVSVKVHEDAAIEVRHSAHEQGMGCMTVLTQIAAEAFKTSVDKVRLVSTDTDLTGYEHGTLSSRTTHHTGMALMQACEDAKRQIFELASRRLGVPPDGLDVMDGTIYVRGVPERAVKVSELFTPLGFLLQGGELVGRGVASFPSSSEDLHTGQGKRVTDGFGYGTTAVEVAVNVETGEVKVLRLGGCFDMGTPVNPKMCEGQMEMGMALGIGNTLYEELVYKNGEVLTSNLSDYKIPTSADLPTNRDTASLAAGVPHHGGPFGAKGFGEVPHATVAAAVGNALYRAAGIRIMEMPISRESVLKALKER